MNPKKIKSIEELGEIIQVLKKSGKKIVQCHGCFDIVHYGHIQHFLNAKEQGDVLIVTITPDRFIQKGPGRPFFNEDLRLKHLSSIECIDFVAMTRWPTAVETIKIIKPDIYVKGSEALENKNTDEVNRNETRISNLALEEEALKQVGGKLYLTDEITFSSSRIINQISSSLPEESKQFLNMIRENFEPSKIRDILNSLKNLKVLIVGDSILDEFVYCQSMERSGKEALISNKFLESEIHPGGVLAIANHLAGFSDNVHLLTCLGGNDHEIINNELNKKITKIVYHQQGMKTLVKTRFINKYKSSKMFLIYNTDELETSRENEENILQYLDKNKDSFDLIMISDFGHGMISKAMIDYLCNSNNYLALNCQLNGGNLGYNFITKYKRADFASLNDRELRLPFQEKSGDPKSPLKKLSDSMNIKKINVTLGKSGSVYYHNGNFYYAPSFTKDPVDTLGSGDAVFALTSLLSYKDVDPNLVSLT